MKLKRRTLLEIGFLAASLALIVYPFGSHIYYLHKMVPRDVSDIAGYFRRFGEPQRARLLERDGKRFYEFQGHLPPGVALAYVSAPPAYVFDEQGHFIDWCSDPGDQPDYYRRWPFSGTNWIEPAVLKQKFVQ